jgi:glycogen operon protein
LLNAYWEALDFQLPPLTDGQQWHRLVDTARTAPDDFVEPGQAPKIEGTKYQAEARSVVVLLAR